MAGGRYQMERGWMEHPVFGNAPYSKREAWAYLIENAAWKPVRFDIRGQIVLIERGQFATSVRRLAAAWDWDKAAVSRFLTRLKTETMIETSTETGQIIITVCNYDLYQASPSESETPSETESETPARQQRDTKEEGKEYIGYGYVNPSPLSAGVVRVSAIALIHYVNIGSVAGRTALHSARLRKVEDITTKWRGAWSAGVNYLYGDGVTSAEGHGFASRKSGNIGNQPPTTFTSNTWWTAVVRSGEDGTPGAPGAAAVVVSPPSLSYTIACNSAGTPKAGEFNKVTTFVVTQSGADLSNDGATTYEVVNTNCAATLGGTNNKVLTQTAMTADSAKSSVTVKRSGVSVGVVEVTLTKALDGAPGRRVTDDTISAPNGTSFGTPNGGPIALALDTGELATISFSAGYRAMSSGSFIVYARLEWREYGGTWAALGADETGMIAAYLDDPGAISISRTLTGSGGIKIYEFRLLLRRSNISPTIDWNPRPLLAAVN